MFALRMAYANSRSMLAYVAPLRTALLKARQIRAMGTYIAEIAITTVSLISCMSVGSGIYFNWELQVFTMTETQ